MTKILPTPLRSSLALLLIISMAALSFSLHSSLIVDQISEYSSEDKLREATGRASEDRLYLIDGARIFLASSVCDFDGALISLIRSCAKQSFHADIVSRLFTSSFSCQGPPSNFLA